MEEKEETDENEWNIEEKGDHTLPEGWKIRTSEGTSGIQKILSPDVKKYKSRKLAVHNIFKKGDDTVPGTCQLEDEEY